MAIILELLCNFLELLVFLLSGYGIHLVHSFYKFADLSVLVFKTVVDSLQKLLVFTPLRHGQ